MHRQLQRRGQREVAPQRIHTGLPHRLLQRQCACGGTPGPTGECAACGKRRKAALQRASQCASGFNLAPPMVQEVLRSPGQPMDGATRTQMETRFGHDFSGVRVQRVQGPAASRLTVGAAHDPAEHEADRMATQVVDSATPARTPAGLRPDFGRVRIHSDARAAASARAVNALAYTVGQDVVFGAGRYQPHSQVGQRLLAHELTHVLQQGAHPLVQRQCASEFPCLRTPFPPGQVRFNGCSAEQLGEFAVMPEDGTELTTPTNGTWLDTDGFRYQRHTPRYEWFKIPGHCDVEIQCSEGDFTCSKCCNLAASIFKGSPRWTSDGHQTANPWPQEATTETNPAQL